MDASSNLESNLIIQTFLSIAIFFLLSNMLNVHYYFADSDIIVKAELLTSDGKPLTLSNQPAPPSSPLPPKLPTSLKLVSKVKTDNSCNTVCYHMEYTYIGQNGGAIDRVDQQGKVDKAFIKLKHSVVSVTAHEDALFCLMYCDSSPSEISVYDISGKFLRKWNHSTLNGWRGSRMFIINNSQLVVGDWTGKQIIIYSFTGDVIRRVPCPASLTMSENVSMTSCGDDYAVISVRSAAIVVKISLKDGEVIWTVETDPDPCGMVLHNNHHLLVAHYSSYKAELSILDTQSGKFDRNLYYSP